MAAAILYTRSERFADGTCYKHHGSEIIHKRGRQKTVTWPINEKLCEVRYFLVDDAPSFLGKQRSLPLAHNTPCYKESKNLIEDHPIDAKRIKLTSGTRPNGNLAPAFGLSMARRSHVPKIELEASMVVAAPWHCPHKFILDDSWVWAGGEESTEVALQKQREIRMFEAFYPRLASVPDSPAEPLEGQFDDSLLLKVPLIPLEEEEEETQDVEPEEMIEINHTENVVPEWKVMSDSSNLGTDVLKHGNDILHSNLMAESVKLNQSNLMSEADSNIAAVAAAACMIVRSLGESDLVDEKLLLEILKNPSLLKSLTCSNRIVKNKSQVKNNDTANQVSQEPITNLLGKLPPDHGAYLKASPVSVLARWEEGAFTESPFGTTPIANGDANIRQPVIAISNAVTASPPMGSLPSHVSHKTSHTGRGFLQRGFEIAPRAVPEACKNSSSFEPPTPNLQESSMLHPSKPKDEVRLSNQNVSRNNVLSASCSMQSAPTPSSSVLSTSSNSELSWRAPVFRDPPIRRVVKDPESKTLQAKMTVLCTPPNMGGGGRAKRFCMYFNSPRGCRNGSSCAFVHQSLDSELNTVAL